MHNELQYDSHLDQNDVNLRDNNCSCYCSLSSANCSSTLFLHCIRNGFRVLLNYSVCELVNLLHFALGLISSYSGKFWTNQDASQKTTWQPLLHSLVRCFLGKSEKLNTGIRPWKRPYLLKYQEGNRLHWQSRHLLIFQPAAGNETSLICIEISNVHQATRAM